MVYLANCKCCRGLRIAIGCVRALRIGGENPLPRVKYTLLRAACRRRRGIL
jgi:hypothetical protein